MVRADQAFDVETNELVSSHWTRRVISIRSCSRQYCFKVEEYYAYYYDVNWVVKIQIEASITRNDSM